MTDWLAQRPQLEWNAPAAGLFGLVRLPTDIDARAFVQAAIAHHGVVVAPGEFFGASSSFRLAWAQPAAQLAPALDALGDSLSEFGIKIC